MGVKILGTGKFIPELTITNNMFEQMIDTTDEWITSRTGIKERHIAVDMMTVEMAEKAAAAAIEDAGINPEAIDRVICSALTTDYMTPSCACLVANKVGAVRAVGFDINAACAGFVFALDLANRFLADDDCKTILVIGAEEMSKMVDYNDRSTCVLFGDGAGAAVVTSSDKAFYSSFGGDPTGATELFARGIEPSNPFMQSRYDMHTRDGLTHTTGHGLYQNGKEVYKFAIKAMPSAVSESCAKAGISPDELDLIIPHQANMRIIETAAKNLKLPMEKFFINIHKYGNMSSACIPIALHEARKEGRLKEGQRVCLVGFGGGLVYGGAVFEA